MRVQERGEEGDDMRGRGVGWEVGKGEGWLRGAADFNGLWDAEEPSTG